MTMIKKLKNSVKHNSKEQLVKSEFLILTEKKVSTLALVNNDDNSIDNLE